VISTINWPITRIDQSGIIVSHGRHEIREATVAVAKPGSQLYTVYSVLIGFRNHGIIHYNHDLPGNFQS